MDKEKLWYVLIKENKKEKAMISNNLDGTQGNCARWKRQSQKVPQYIITLMSHFLNDNLQKWRPDQRLIEVRKQIDKDIEGSGCDYKRGR